MKKNLRFVSVAAAALLAVAPVATSVVPTVGANVVQAANNTITGSVVNNSNAATGNTAAITAIGNDYSYDEVFEKQVAALVNAGDIVWGISTSGNSENVIRALKRGIRDEAVTIGFAGRDGGKMAGLCDHLLIVKHQRTARIQELHILAAHIICGLVDEKMFGKYSG